MSWIDYGVARRVPNRDRMYVLTNEQINLIANLVTGTNDVFSFQLPAPFYIDQRREAMIYDRIDFIFRSKPVNSPSAGAYDRLQVDLQYSDKEPAADWDQSGEDVEDENIQAMFDGPFIFGLNGELMAPDTDATLAVNPGPSDHITNVHYYPPDDNGLDAFFPLTVVLSNATFDRDLVDQIGDVATFTAFEKVYIRPYFHTRNLTADEIALMTSEYYGMVPLA